MLVAHGKEGRHIRAQGLSETWCLRYQACLVRELGFRIHIRILSGYPCVHKLSVTAFLAGDLLLIPALQLPCDGQGRDAIRQGAAEPKGSVATQSTL